MSQVLYNLLLITVLIDLTKFNICVFMPGCSPNPLWSVPHPTERENVTTRTRNQTSKTVAHIVKSF